MVVDKFHQHGNPKHVASIHMVILVGKHNLAEIQFCSRKAGANKLSFEYP